MVKPLGRSRNRWTLSKILMLWVQVTNIEIWDEGAQDCFYRGAVVISCLWANFLLLQLFLLSSGWPVTEKVTVRLTMSLALSLMEKHYQVCRINRAVCTLYSHGATKCRMPEDRHLNIQTSSKAIPFQPRICPQAPRVQDSRHMKVVRLSALRTGRLYPSGYIPGTRFR